MDQAFSKKVKKHLTNKLKISEDKDSVNKKDFNSASKLSAKKPGEV